MEYLLAYPLIRLSLQIRVHDISFSHFSLKKGQKTKFQDQEFVTADNKNAIETPFFAILRPRKSIGGILIGL